MKRVKSLIAAFAMACLLSVTALAGTISSGGDRTSPPPPPPATTSGVMQTGFAGEVETGDTGEEATTAIPLVEVALSVMSGVLSLF